MSADDVRRLAARLEALDRKLDVYARRRALTGPAGAADQGRAASAGAGESAFPPGA